MTYASDKGFTVGTRCVVKHLLNGDTHHKFDLGDVVVVVEDDGTKSPNFRRISDNVTSYARIERLELAPEDVKPTPLKNFIIEVSDAETTVKVGKLLSADQLKRIIEILGE